MKALGVVCLDHAADVDEARAGIRRTAESHHLDLVDTVTFRATEQGWIFRLLETVNLLGAHAVIVPEHRHIAGFEAAVTGVADLHSATSSYPFVGYGSGHTRPSDTSRGGRR